MTNSANLGDSINRAPAAFDLQAGERLREDFGATFADLKEDERALVVGVAGCSPYLFRLMRRAPDRVADILRRPPEASLREACEAARRAGQADRLDAQMKDLRRAKEDAALAVALADIAGAWDAMEAARAVSDFADAAVSAALGAAAGADGTDGVTVIAMGKLGAKELNYSSDIDLIVLYDPAAMSAGDPGEARKTAIRITRDAVALLQNQTADGYVFRTDLRLRPDPGVSPVALTVSAAEAYYEAYGQNWERMAFVKARAAAGDIALGERFLQSLRPFVWRKFLDFAAIEDVHAVKRQIHAARGGAKIEFAGHDIKLGRGGIREIEFFVQTQQLILGGKNEKLRQRATLDALAALSAHAAIDERQRDDLDAAYRYLRLVEHRLQMINDEQTHRIPREAGDIERLAAFLGEKTAASFRDRLRGHLQIVRRHYDDLFVEDEPQPPPIGPLVFTGVENDPATIETLRRLGFDRAEDVAEKIRRWHAGGIRATRSERARILLTKLVPPLLDALSKAGDPDDAFFAFAAFIERLPAGVQVFSLLLNNVELFDALIRIMTISPFLGRELARRINFVEQLVQKGAGAPPPALESYAPALAEEIDRAKTYEELLNAARRWAGERKFAVVVQLAADALPATIAAAHLSAIAEACITALVPPALAEMRRQHGSLDGELAIVALGRLGAGEMTAASDIDLMFIYDAPLDAKSDGARSLTSTEYFTRLVRRLVTALSAQTEEGRLYDVDMQLRPSGGAGPAAVSLAAFRHYYREDAWTWEIMALTKARVIGGASGLGAAVEDEIDSILRRPRNREGVANDVHEMRRRLAQAKPAASVWDVKNAIGGLTDIAFICQHLALVAAHDRGRPPRATAAAIDWLAAGGELSESDAAALAEAHAMFEAVLQAGRAATGGAFSARDAGETLQSRMASICGAGTVQEAERSLAERQSRVAKVYAKVIGSPLGE